MENIRRKHLEEIAKNIGIYTTSVEVRDKVRQQIDNLGVLIGDVEYIEYVKEHLWEQLDIFGRGNPIMDRGRGENIYYYLDTLVAVYAKTSNIIEPIIKKQNLSDKDFKSLLLCQTNDEKESIVKQIRNVIHSDASPKTIAIILVALRQMKLIDLGNINLLSKVWVKEFGYRATQKALESGLSNHISGDHTVFNKDNRDAIDLRKSQFE